MPQGTVAETLLFSLCFCLVRPPKSLSNMGHMIVFAACSHKNTGSFRSCLFGLGRIGDINRHSLTVPDAPQPVPGPFHLREQLEAIVEANTIFWGEDRDHRRRLAPPRRNPTEFWPIVTVLSKRGFCPSDAGRCLA